LNQNSCRSAVDPSASAKPLRTPTTCSAHPGDLRILNRNRKSPISPGLIKIKSATYSAWYDITITFTTSIINFSMLTGTVKFFNETKGFGFIKEDESGTEYFVHITGLVDKVRENDKVTFELKEGRKGMNAVSVKQAYA
jgi:CspA family cold shock protein